jgi:putative ABC transport system permease protein
MIRMTIRSLWARKLRFALTSLAVILGVAFMAGTFILTDTTSRSFDQVFESSNAGVDVVVQRATAPGLPAGAPRERVPASMVADVAAVDGVAGAAGSVQGFAQLVDADGTASSLDGIGAVVGTNWIENPDLNPFDLATGRAPAGADEAVVDAAAAKAQHWSLGDRITVLGRTGASTLRLVGTARFGELDGLPGTTVVATADETAQRLFGEPGRYDSISVTASGGDARALATAVRSALGDDQLEVVTGEEQTADQQAQVKDDLRFFNTFLLAFAYIALFVGTFIIRNTFSIVVAQRTREWGVLRALGASRRQILTSVLAEAVLVGLVASAAGLVVGAGMAVGLKGLLGAVGLDLPDAPMVILGHTVVTSLLVGLAVTVVSAFGPAVRGSRVAPIAAMRDVESPTGSRSIVRVGGGVLLAAIGGAAFLAGRGGDGGSAVQLVGIGSLLLVLAVVTLGPVLVRPGAAVLGAGYPAAFGMVGHLARENVRRSPKRSAASASALTIGVALVAFITILAASTKASIADTIDHAVRADYVVDSGAWDQGGFSPALGRQLAALPQVGAVSPLRTAPVAIDGTGTFLQAVDAETLDRVVDLEVTAGHLAGMGTTGIAVHADVAKDHGWKLGDTVEVTFARTGVVPLTVTALYDTVIGAAEGGDYLVDLDAFEANVTDQFDQQVFVRLADGVSKADGRAAIDASLAAWPNAHLLDRSDYKAAMTSEIGQILNLVYGMLALAVLIALIGIANTLVLSVHERTRELGVLRAVGMQRGQTRAAIRWESVLITLLGTGAGLVLGLLGSWGIVGALRDDVTSLVLPTTPLLIVVAGAVLAGVLAAVGPARRASNLDVLQAIAEQ